MKSVSNNSNQDYNFTQTKKAFFMNKDSVWDEVVWSGWQGPRDPHALSLHGETPLSYYLSHVTFNGTELECQHGLHVCEGLLALGVDPNRRSVSGNTALVNSLTAPVPFMRLLIKAGADINSFDAENMSILEELCLYPATVQDFEEKLKLLEGGGFDFWKKDQSGQACIERVMIHRDRFFASPSRHAFFDRLQEIIRTHLSEAIDTSVNKHSISPRL